MTQEYYKDYLNIITETDTKLEELLHDRDAFSMLITVFEPYANATVKKCLNTKLCKLETTIERTISDRNIKLKDLKTAYGL